MIKIFNILFTIVFLLLNLETKPQSITWLGFISPGGAGSSAEAVSSDGSVVVGSSSAPSNQYHAFRWTPTTGMIDLGTLGGRTSYGLDVSEDGQVVVGSSEVSMIGTTSRAFRWTQSGGLQSLGTLGGVESQAFAVSADGSIIVGQSQTLNTPIHAFRWMESGGMYDLGAPDSNSWSAAYCISANNSVIGGVATFSSAFEHAALWNGGWIDLGTLGGNDSYVNGISDDGSVAVGSSRTSDGYTHAFRWSFSTGLQDLGVLATGYNSQAIDVNSDGSIIIGWAQNEYGQDRAVRWTNANLIEDLTVTYASILGDAKLLSAKDISPDGRFIVGTGYRNGVSEAFLLDTGPTSINENHNLPREFSLFQNFPNPFNPVTKIKYSIPERVRVKLIVSDILGKQIQTIVDEEKDRGSYEVTFDATNLSSGIYFCKMQASNYVNVIKMILVK